MSQVKFSEEQLNEYYDVLVGHGVIRDDEIRLNDSESRMMFTELLKTMLKSLTHEQHAHLMRTI